MAGARPLESILNEHRVIVCVGSGGVGKTTTAAALALAGATRGRRVLCLTIDPAKRLATSLGLGEMTSEEKVVDPAILAAHGVPPGGSFTAMMLDAKKTFDELVRRHASSPARAERILENELYRYISSSLAGTQEYMAMEKLHAVESDPRFDLVVLDTPPTSNALDFLDAPERLSNLVDSKTMQWIVTAFEGGRGVNLVGRGARLVLQGIAKLTGAGFLEQVAVFLTEFNDLFGGFRKRAAEVEAALRGPDVAYVVVTSPAPLAMEEAVFFAERLGEAKMSRDALVVNQVHRVLPAVAASSASLEAEASPHLGGLDAVRVVPRMRRAYDDEKTRAEADRLAIEGLRARVDPSLPLVEIPIFDGDVHDLEALRRVADALVG